MLIDDARINQVTGAILGGAIEVHRVIGPGLLESPYMPCFEFELAERGLSYVTQAPVGLVYKTLRLDAVYKVDLLVEDLVVVEVKCVETVAAVHRAQLLTYLRLTDLRVGLLLNFGAERMKDGIRRIVNDHKPSPSSPLRINHPL